MHRMRLTITKVTNKLGFIAALRDIFTSLSFQERVNFVNQLPFKDEDMYMSSEELAGKLGGFAEYTYEQVASDDPHAPPWERQDYIDAMIWYNALSQEDKDKIDVIRRASMPWG